MLKENKSESLIQRLGSDVKERCEILAQAIRERDREIRRRAKKKKSRGRPRKGNTCLFECWIRRYWREQKQKNRKVKQ